jgi:hypothetical protein
VLDGQGLTHKAVARILLSTTSPIPLPFPGELNREEAVQCMLLHPEKEHLLSDLVAADLPITHHVSVAALPEVADSESPEYIMVALR